MDVVGAEFDEAGKIPLFQRRGGSTELAMASSETPLYRINDFVFLSPGTTNSYLVTTATGDVVISTGLAVEGVLHRAKFNRVSGAPVRKIILTQAHLDIIGGTNAFRGRGCSIIAHENSRACQADDARLKAFRERRNPRFFPSEMSALSDADRQAMAEGAASVYDKVEADILVRDAYRFSVGGIDFEVIALPGGETTDSLAVWLPQHRILFTGNALGPLFPHMPNLHTIRGDRPRAVLPYIATYQRLLEFGAEILVTGHFNPIRGRDFIREELTRLRDAVQHVHDETVRGMNEGQPLERLKREVNLPPHLLVGQDYGTVMWAVEAIWHGYAGWFHYRSTTELYETPVHAVYADIADMAGPDALAGRAQRFLAEKRPLEAIHLAEMALARTPDHLGALSAYSLAHEALLAAAPARNRWYRYWLNGEIAQARARIGAAAGGTS